MILSLLKLQAQNKDLPSIIIQGGTIHVGNGDVIQNGTIIIEGGQIKEIGPKKEVKNGENVTVINAEGKHIYPGFINVNNTLGLREIDAVRATRDFKEAGLMNPHVRALIAFNTESKVIQTVRSNGVLISQATPRGGRVSGQSAVMKLNGWNWEDASILNSDGIHINWPKTFTYKWNGSGLDMIENKNKLKEVDELQHLFSNAKSYQISNEKKDVRLESLLPLLKGQSNIYMHANLAKDIIESVKFAQKNGIKRIVIVGGKEAHLIPQFLKANNISVILDRVHSLPMYEGDPILTPYQIADILNKNEIKYCLSWTGDMEAMNSRNLPFGAGSTIAYGVPYEQAVSSITLNTAKIIGIDQQYGSLEKGKSATLIISEGDALDMRTNNILHAFIDGDKVDLNNHQRELNKKYSKKYQLSNE